MFLNEKIVNISFREINIKFKKNPSINKFYENRIVKYFIFNSTRGNPNVEQASAAFIILYVCVNVCSFNLLTRKWWEISSSAKEEFGSDLKLCTHVQADVFAWF